MTNTALYDTRRISLGLSTADAAAYHNVTDRTIRRWCEVGAPEGALRELDDLEIRMMAAVENATQMAKSTNTEVVTLWRYRTREGHNASDHARYFPFTAHAMVVQWTADQIGRHAIDVVIEWAD